MESKNTNLSSRLSSIPEFETDEDESNSEEYETDSSNNSDSEDHEAEADKSGSNYYQKKILRNKKEQQEILKLIQLSEAKQDFATALDEVNSKRKKTLNRKEKKVPEGPLRKSDRHKDRKRINLSEKHMFARAFADEEDMMYEPYLLDTGDYKNTRRSSRLKDTKVNYSVDDLFNRLYGAPEMEQSQTEGNEMTVGRVKKRAEKFRSNRAECSEWPKVVLSRLPRTEMLKYCDDVNVKQKREEKKVPRNKVKRKIANI